MSPDPARAEIVVDLAAIRHNVRRLREELVDQLTRRHAIGQVEPSSDTGSCLLEDRSIDRLERGQ